jgi:hypothetical protein
MAPPRTWDYDLLKRLIREHPEWTYSQYADVLTDDVRTRDPFAPRVLPDSARRVVSQYRSQWEDEGVVFPDRGVVHAGLLPPLGMVAATQRMATPLRYLREISKERRGEAPASDTERYVRKQAIRFEARLKENREIVDVTPNGFVEVRPAREHELDECGNLVELSAWAVPGYEPRHRLSGRGRG